MTLSEVRASNGDFMRRTHAASKEPFTWNEKLIENRRWNMGYLHKRPFKLFE